VPPRHWRRNSSVYRVPRSTQVCARDSQSGAAARCDRWAQISWSAASLGDAIQAVTIGGRPRNSSIRSRPAVDLRPERDIRDPLRHCDLGWACTGSRDAPARSICISVNVGQRPDHGGVDGGLTTQSMRSRSLPSTGLVLVGPGRDLERHLELVISEQHTTSRPPMSAPAAISAGAGCGSRIQVS